MTDAAYLLVRLRDDAFTLRADAGQIVLSPVSRLDDEARGLIRQYRADLLELLVEEQIGEWHREATLANPFTDGPVADLDAASKAWQEWCDKPGKRIGRAG